MERIQFASSIFDIVESTTFGIKSLIFFPPRNHVLLSQNTFFFLSNTQNTYIDHFILLISIGI